MIHKFKYAPKVSVVTRSIILKRDNYVCAYCHESAQTVDHIIPRTVFGSSNKHTNLVACCAFCNSILTNKLFINLNDKKNFMKKYFKTHYVKFNNYKIRHTSNIKIIYATT